MATVMDQVGWPVAQLTGGYQTWRRRVLARLYDVESEAPGLPPLVLLDGPTGVGKTAVLALMAERGTAVLDLEGLAAHRGSLFGATAEAQPPQKLFDSRLAVALEALDPTRPVLVEAEASRIGALTLPPRLWAAMKAAPRIALTGSLEDRTAFSRAAYADIAADPAALDAVLSRLPLRLGRATIERWKGLAREGDLSVLIAELLETHYDPAYRRAASKYEGPVAVVLSPVSGSEASRNASLAAIEAALHGFTPGR